jgi:adenylosuccinate lyase
MEPLAALGAEVMALDLSDEHSRRELAEQLTAKVGALDALVNNAGFGEVGPLETLPLDRARAIFEVNVFGLMGLTQQLLPAMRERGRGRIVNISSIAGRWVSPGSGWYGASKFALEALSTLSIAATHLSRLAEEIVLWTSPQFGFAQLPDEWSTGSSIMPQKRNPDAAELIRAKASLITGLFSALQGAVKALPLAYAKDLQDDKRLTFEAFDTFDLCARAMAGMVETIRFKPDMMQAAAGRGYSTATDLADWLVRELGLPFRQAHHLTGAAVKQAETLGVDLAELSLDQLKALDPRITDGVYTVLTPAASVASRRSYGGTAPDQVRAQIARWKESL